MQIRWQEDAISDLQHLQDYISQDNPKTAKEIAQRILDVVSLLSSQPNMGRPGRVFGTRELVISGTPYLLPYRVRHQVIEILRVLHGAMQWPDKFSSKFSTEHVLSYQKVTADSFSDKT
jgi:toxin ParE1/3/4